MQMTEEQVRAIVANTVKQLLGNAGIGGSRPWLCDTAEEAIESAKASQRILLEMSLEKRSRLIEAMRIASRANAKRLAEIANEETGYGKVADKTAKNLLAADKTPGVEDLEAGAFTGDYGLTLVERAPFGVIGAITPSTNPTSTVINNSISMIAAGNAVVYNPHPGAKRASTETMRILNEAIVGAGGPASLICTVKNPTLETGKTIMEHPDIPLLAITGGEAVVKVAMKTGKKVIAAGPGNPPVIVDDTADIPQAAKDIVLGASFDNNVLCIAEKEVFAFEKIADRLMIELEKNGAFRIQGADIYKVMKTVLVEKNGEHMPGRDFVGRDAAVILQKSGVAFTGTPRLVIVEVPEDHPFVTTEMLMPVLGIVRVMSNSIDDAIGMALKAEHNYKHTAMIHSQNVSHLSKAAKLMNTTIFVKNAPSYAGLGFEGEGYTTLTIATPTGEGLTSARSFTRIRRCVLHGSFRIV